MLRRSSRVGSKRFFAARSQLDGTVAAASHLVGATMRSLQLIDRIVSPAVRSPLSGAATIPINVSRYLVAKNLGAEQPAEGMPLSQLLALRDMCLGSTAAYVLARLGSASLEAFLEENMPEFGVDLTLSDDDHVVLVSHVRREVYFSCRGTDGQNPVRKRRDVLAYYAILACRQIDPKDHPRIVNTLSEAREAYRRYALDRHYAFHCIGHSFGGFAASICAQELDCPCTNFNGPVYRPVCGTQLTEDVVERAIKAAVDESNEPENINPLLDVEVPTILHTACGSPAGDTPSGEGQSHSDTGAVCAKSGQLRGRGSVENSEERSLLRRVFSLVAPSSNLHVGTVEESARVRSTRDVPAPAAESEVADTTTPTGANASSKRLRTIKRRGTVHHVQLGHDVVSLVGGALPHECERYTRLRYHGWQLDVSGAHYRSNILLALDEHVRRAAREANVDLDLLYERRRVIAQLVRRQRALQRASWSSIASKLPSEPVGASQPYALLTM
jgi:hypothetical protein